MAFFRKVGGRTRPWLLIGIVAALIVVGAAWLGFDRWQASRTYTLVQLMGGQSYVGRLTKFPTWQLRDGYSLQITQGEQNQPNIQLLPLSQVVWSPKVLNINPENVVFSAPLREDSRAVQGIRNQK